MSQRRDELVATFTSNDRSPEAIMLEMMFSLAKFSYVHGYVFKPSDKRMEALSSIRIILLLAYTPPFIKPSNT
jgi:hypothetical protein